MIRALMVALSLVVITPAAAATPSAPYRTLPLSDAQLSEVVGMGIGDRGFRAMVDDKLSLDLSILASASRDVVDCWWAYNGAEMIAANLAIRPNLL